MTGSATAPACHNRLTMQAKLDEQRAQLIRLAEVIDNTQFTIHKPFADTLLENRHPRRLKIEDSDNVPCAEEGYLAFDPEKTNGN